jgi:hypothetical protein
MTICVIYTSEPAFPATDQRPDAQRVKIGNFWVDYEGSAPVQADIDAILNPSSAALAAEDQATLNSMLAAPGSVVRGLALVVLDLANGKIPIGPATPYTPTQLLNLIQAKMR